MPWSMCKSLNVQSFTDVGSRLSTWAWVCVLRRVLCVAWVCECCVRPCVRVSVACCMHACMHAWGLLPPIDMFIFQTSSIPSIWWYSLCSQIRSKSLPLFPNAEYLSFNRFQQVTRYGAKWVKWALRHRDTVERKSSWSIIPHLGQRELFN